MLIKKFNSTLPRIGSRTSTKVAICFPTTTRFLSLQAAVTRREHGTPRVKDILWSKEIIKYLICASIYQINYIIEEWTTSSLQSGLYQGHISTHVFDSEPHTETYSISPATKSRAGCNFRVWACNILIDVITVGALTQFELIASAVGLRAGKEICQRSTMLRE